MRIRQLHEIWPADLSILEIDPPHARLVAAFRQSGFTNYLSVVDDQARRAAITAQCPAASDRIAVYYTKKIVRQNNAEALVLHRQAPLSVALFRPVRHARFVAWEFRPGISCLLATLLGLLQWLVGRLKWPTLVRVPKQPGPRGLFEFPLIVFAVRNPRPHQGARRFIPHQLCVEGFLRKLCQSNIRHAVLRWFDRLPAIEPGEDLDLLVEDSQLDKVREILNGGVGIQPIDLYSVSGTAGSNYRGMPYYPPQCAGELLARAQLHQNLCRVPAPREHFLSLAYHAVYHKGESSGLAADVGSPRPGEKPDHDYYAILSSLAASQGLSAPMTLAALDSHLETQGWRPPREMLSTLARHNQWLQSQLANHRTSWQIAAPHFQPKQTPAADSAKRR